MFEAIDAFKVQPYNTFAKKREISSKFSQYMTILLILISIFQVYQTMEQYFLYESFQTTSMFKNLDPNHITDIDKNNIQFSIRVESGPLMGNFTKYFKMYYLEVTYDFITNKRLKETPYPMEHCTLNHFYNPNENQFKELSLQNTFCLPLSYNTQLKKNDTFEQFGAIYFEWCKVGIDDGCIDMTNTTNQEYFSKNYAAENFINIIYQQTQFQIDNYTDPITKYLEIQWFRFNINQNSYAEFQWFVTNYEFKQDARKVSNYEFVPNKMGTYIDREIPLYQDCYLESKFNGSLIMKLYLYPNKLKRELSIIYLTYPQLLIEVYGKVKALLLLFTVICTVANQNYYKLEIARSIFNIKYKFSFLDYATLYNPDRQLTFKQSYLVDKYIDILFVTKSSIRVKMIENCLFSKKALEIFKLVERAPVSLKTLVKNYFEIFVKSGKKLLKEHKNKRAMLQLINSKNKKEDDENQQDDNQEDEEDEEDDEEKQQNENDEKEDQNSEASNFNQDQAQGNIKTKQLLSKDQQLKKKKLQILQNLMKQKFIDFIKNMSYLNNDDVLRNIYDIQVESQFTRYLNHEFLFDAKYNIGEKLAQYEKFKKKLAVSHQLDTKSKNKQHVKIFYN